MLPLIFAGVAAVAGFTGAWTYQSARYERLLTTQQTEYLKRDFKALEIAHADTIRLHEQAAKAASAATTRQNRIAADRDRLRADVDGLRDELTASRLQLPDASCPSVRDHAAALNNVFGQCAAAIEGLAGKADGHASDSLMLQEAWPRLPAKD